MSEDRKRVNRGFFPEINYEAPETIVHHYSQKWGSILPLILIFYWIFTYINNIQISILIVVATCILIAIIVVCCTIFLIYRREGIRDLTTSSSLPSQSISDIVRFLIVLTTINGISLAVGPQMVASDYTPLKALVFIIYSAFANGGVTALSLAIIATSIRKINKG